jgi:uncharacterized SAM-binding protein YcdF (DUF218 family)
MTRKRSVYLRSALVFGMVVVGGLAIFREDLLLAVSDFLVVQDTLQPASVIHVIAGEDHRTQHAIELYQQGFAKTIFFTGGWCENHQYFHGQHGVEVALASGVPEQSLAFDDSPVTSTYSEAELLKKLLDGNPQAALSVIVVSDPFHMRRAQWTYRQILGDGVRVQMAPVPVDQTPYKIRWWEDGRSRRYVKDEYQKFVYYIARYQLTWGVVREWLASYDTG